MQRNTYIWLITAHWHNARTVVVINVIYLFSEKSRFWAKFKLPQFWCARIGNMPFFQNSPTLSALLTICETDKPEVSKITKFICKIPLIWIFKNFLHARAKITKIWILLQIYFFGRGVTHCTSDRQMFSSKTLDISTSFLIHFMAW